VRPGALFVLAFALLPVCGAPLLAHPAFGRYGLLCRTVLSAGAGAVVLSLLMTLGALSGAAWGIPWLVVAAMAVSLLLRVCLGQEADGRDAPEQRPATARRLGNAVSAACVAASLHATLTAAATSADLLLFWGPKAQAFAAARTIDAAYMRAPFHTYLHADYPPLVTNLFAFAAMLAGRFPWGAATLTFPLAMASLAAGLPGLLGAGRPRQAAAAVSCLAVASACLMGITFNVAGNGDGILLFFEACAAALLASPDASRPSRLLLAGLFLAGAASAKVEGLAFVLAAVALFAIVDRRARQPRAAALLLLPTGVCLSAWFAFGARNRIFGFYEGYGPLLRLHRESLGLILRTLAGELFAVAWGLPFLLPIALLLVAPKAARNGWIPLFTAASLAVFFVFTYLHSNYLLVEWIHWSAGRIYTPVAVLLALGAMPANASNTSVPNETASPMREPGGE
jgi:hypothetical protein